jgi:hypothetical protein
MFNLKLCVMKMYFKNSVQLIHDLNRCWQQEQIKKDHRIPTHFLIESKLVMLYVEAKQL